MYQIIDVEDQLIVEILEEQPTTSPIWLRRSTREKKKNSKYANVAIMEEEKELTSFKKAS